MIPFLFRRENYTTGSRFACIFSNIRCFNTMINRITDQMHQWIRKCFYKVLIEVCIFTSKYQVYFFLQIPREVPDNSRKTTKDLFDRLHPGLHYGRL